MNILEYSFNCCETSGTTDPYEDYCHRLDTLSASMPPELQRPLQRIYLGFEFCENMFCMSSIPDLKKKIQHTAQCGYRISFVLPIMHQSCVKTFIDTIQSLESQDLLDEWIINDIGTLIIMRETLGITRAISLGRMFDKGLRETRVDITEDEFIRRNFEDLQPKGGESEEFLGLVHQYHITGIETDTFPDGILDSTRAGLRYHVHYPDIYLSSAAYCEYEGLGKERPFMLHSSCSMPCRLYGQRIKTTRGALLKKIGNVLYAEQTRPIEACVRGDIRMVYSCRE